MNDSDSERFLKKMALFAEIFKEVVSEGRTEIYFVALGDLSIEEFERAADIAIGSCIYFPKPVELRGFVRGSAQDLALAASEGAQAAWALLEDARRIVGYWNSIWFDESPIAQALIDTFGGWLSFCDQMHMVFSDETGRQIGGLSPEMGRAKQKEFLVNYQRALKIPRRIERYQTGKCETENRSTVAGWKRGPLVSERYFQTLGIVTACEVQTAKVEYDALTGRIADQVRFALESGGARALIEALSLASTRTARPWLLTTGEITTLEAEIVNSDREKRQSLVALRDVSLIVKKPLVSTMTDDDVRARLILLRNQADALTEMESHEQKEKA